MESNKAGDKNVQIGTHGEDYGNWMSMPVLYMVGLLLAVALLVAVAAFALFHIPVLGWIFVVVALALFVLLCWIVWIRKQYSLSGGAMMAKAYQTVLGSLNFDGNGRLLEVGCGSGALSVLAALTWPNAKIVGIDKWGPEYAYTKKLCEQNAASEGVGARCEFKSGDANKLDFPDESFDAVVSNYVYHNIVGSDKQTLLRETLRVLKKGGVFALNDDMKPRMYGDLEAFAQELRDAGFKEVRIVDTAEKIFGSHSRAGIMMLGSSCMLVGRK